MKRQWIAGVTLLALISGYSWADVAPPTDEILKKEFSEEFTGMMRLDNITLHQLSVQGNQATYSAEGDLSSTEDLYSIVGMAADYHFVEKTWTKDKQVKFSAMVTATGTPASGWKTEFFSMQTAAKNSGYPLPNTENKDKYLVITDSNFYAKLAKIEASYAEKHDELSKMQATQASLEKKIADIDKEIKRSWGMDKNGKPRDRSDVQQEMLEKMYQVDKQNDPLHFENNYSKTIYEPALDACQKKPDCNADPLRKARDNAVEDQRRQYYSQHKVMSDNIKDEMAARDKKLAPLHNEQGQLRTQLVSIDNNQTELQRAYDRWQKDITDLRRRGIIH